MYHLPQDILRYIYSFDPTYKIYFEKYIKYILDKQHTLCFCLLPYGQYRVDMKHRNYICVNPSLS